MHYSSLFQYFYQCTMVPTLVENSKFLVYLCLLTVFVNNYYDRWTHTYRIWSGTTNCLKSTCTLKYAFFEIKTFKIQILLFLQNFWFENNQLYAICIAHNNSHDCLQSCIQSCIRILPKHLYEVLPSNGMMFLNQARPQPAKGWLWAHLVTDIVFVKVCVCVPTYLSTYLPMFVCTHPQEQNRYMEKQLLRKK